MEISHTPKLLGANTSLRQNVSAPKRLCAKTSQTSNEKTCNEITLELKKKTFCSQAVVK